MDTVEKYVGPEYGAAAGEQSEACRDCGQVVPAWMGGSHCDRDAYVDGWHRLDPSIPFKVRFKPTAHAVWDMAKRQILCIDCGGWTDHSDLPKLQVMLGRILCEHCGEIVSP